MGRGGFKRNRGRGGGRNGGRPNERYPKAYSDIVKKNDKLQQYYNGLLGLDKNEEEREAFWAAFQRELPHSFRFCGSKGHAIAVQKLLQTRYVPELAGIAHYDGLPVSPPQPVPWYPDNLAWWMTTSKTVIRKFPPFAAFQKFLVSETNVGNISRQEVVSMIPPLLMDIRPGMAVLDMCAAPGSKAAQLLEMIHAGEEARVRKVMRVMARGLAGDDAQAALDQEDAAEEDPAARLSADPSDDGRATGILVANDADYKRSHLLIHQLKRLSSPNMVVTNHDATIYPSLRLPATPEEVASGKRHPIRYLKFDRILADVPCSGDGTLRKNVALWKEWTPGNAMGLHLVQVRILVRALQMLKVGGRVVYSTCSLNPVENESVVATAVELCGGADKVEILDNSESLPALKRRPGLKSWSVMDKAGRVWNSWAEVEAFAAQSEEDGGSGGVIPSRVVETMFPNANTDKLPLERCLRVYPHLQDTGGFFIVVLEKKEEFKAKEQRKAPETVEVPGTTASSPRGTKRPADDSEENEELADQPAKKQQRAEGETSTAVDVAVPDAPVEDLPVREAAPEEAKAEATTQGEPEAKPEAKLSSDLTENNKMIKENSRAAGAENGEEALGPRRKSDGPYEEPFKFLAGDHPVVADVQRFYHISPKFPTDRFMVRNAYGEPLKAIYYTSGLVRDILACNAFDGTPQKQARVKFVHAGVRMLVKQDAPSAEVCRWRIQAEGMPLLQGYIGEERVVRLHRKSTLKALLVEMFPKFTDDGKGGENALARLGEVGERLPELGMGCFVLKVEPEEGADDAKDDEDGAGVPLEPMALPLYKSFHSLNLMLPKEDRAAMLLRIFNDTTPLVNNSLNYKKKNSNNNNNSNGGQDAKKEEEDSKVASTEAASADKSSGATNGHTEAAEATAKAEENEINEYDAEDAPSS